MNFSLQGKHCSSQMANSLFLAVVISHFYSTVYLMTASNVGQATVSRSIDQIAPVVRQCIPSNPRCARSSTCESLEHPHHAHEEFNLAWIKPSYSAAYVIICV